MNARRRTGLWSAAGVVAVVALAACGGSSGGTDTVASEGQASTSAAATVSTHSGPLGTYLSDAKGKTLYQFAQDKGSTSTCAGTCTSYWPPLLTTGQPVAGSGATSSQLGTTKREDGGQQVTYAGHPLYYYAKDDEAGDTYGQGLNSQGGLWWMVSPEGTMITSSTAPSPTSGDDSHYSY